MRSKIAESKQRQESHVPNTLNGHQEKTKKIEAIDAFLKIAFQHYLLTLKDKPHAKNV